MLFQENIIPTLEVTIRHKDNLFGRTTSIALATTFGIPPWPGIFFGYIVMLRARMFRSLIIRTGIKERNIRAHNITI